VLALIDEINNILPGDLKQARSIVEARNEVVNTAKREADAIKRQAADRARQLVSQEEVLVVARQKANDIVQAAENKARDLRRTANEYVDNALKRAEETLGAALTEMRSSRAEFRTASDKRDPG
jgi:DNA-directed RNA polymerase subunit K/omega